MQEKINLNYEESIEKLNELLEELENGDLTLEKSMDKFKEGMKLYNHCNDILTKTEGEIKIILDAEKDVEQDFIREDE